VVNCFLPRCEEELSAPEKLPLRLQLPPLSLSSPSYALYLLPSHLVSEQRDIKEKRKAGSKRTKTRREKEKETRKKRERKNKCREKTKK
jgi:hypothetical protein